jgi:hypothetical protein
VGPRAVLTLAGLLLLGVAALLLALNGGDEGEDRSAATIVRGAEEPPPAPPGTDAAALRSARALAAGFERVTGDRLELEPDEFFTTATFDDRTLDEGIQADAYFGNFLLFVYPTPSAARQAFRREGRWTDYGSGFYGRAVLGNVVVESTFKRRRADPARGRLLRALRASRAPDDSLPPRERLCSRRGIRLDSGPTGTCKRGPQLFAIRDREVGLRLPGIAIEGVRVKTGPRFQAGVLVDRAKGVFVELSFRVRNAGRGAIKTRPSYELVLGGRRFEEHDAVFGLRDRYPLRPGDSDRDVTLFDVPSELAEEALQEAALQVPGDPASSFAVSDGLWVGHLRLAGPVGRLRARPDPEPEPLPLPPPEPEPLPDPGLTPATPA